MTTCLPCLHMILFFQRFNESEDSTWCVLSKLCAFSLKVHETCMNRRLTKVELKSKGG